MPSYTPPIADTRFVLDQVLGIDRYAKLPGFASASPDIVQAVLEEGGRFCAEVVFPTNQTGDHEGCTRHDDGSVTTPAGFKEAYTQFSEGGWMGLGAPEEFGGQAMPHVVSTAFEEYLISSNMAFGMYPGLTHGAVAAFLAVGSDAQKALYLPKMIAGELDRHDEPDRAAVRHRSRPHQDQGGARGGRHLQGDGHQDLHLGGRARPVENIIHLVLAKIPGGPEGTKGISLFIVPKFTLDADGNPGARNAVSCGSIEEKMGIHANSTCVMNYDGATGWLIGEENRGLAAMFIMMNAARLGVGLQGLGIGEVAYQNAVAYAKDRRQGRALTGPAEPNEKADTLFVHPDVRRMLMECKAALEAARALMLWGALQVDLSHHAAGEAERDAADEMLGLLTPVIKGYFTDLGYEIATKAQQVFGGHGYVREYGMEQYVRDARIAMIYEGTNGVQAMDLVGRKLPRHGGKAAMALFGLISADIAEAKGGAQADLAGKLEKALGELQAGMMWLMQNGMKDPNNAGAAAYPLMTMMGIVSLGWMWLKMARAAQAQIDAGEGDRVFLDAKLVTARFFAERMLPDTGALRRKLEGGAEAVMALPVEAF